MKAINTITLLLLSILTMAQPSLQFRDTTIVNRATYIFEGEVIDTMYYNGETGRRDDLSVQIINGKFSRSLVPLTAHKMKITQLIKGNLKLGTVELIVDDGVVWTNGFPSSPCSNSGSYCPMPIGTKALFFCKISSRKPSPMITDNEIRLVPVEIVGFYMENHYKQGSDREIIGHGFDAFGKIFSSKKEFYQYLAKYPNITIPKEYEKENNKKDSKSNQDKVHDNIEKKEE